MSKLNVDTIEPEGASTTLTLGASGDTVDVPSGATLAVASGATIDLTGATKTGFPAGGLTEADSWRLTTSFTGDADPVINWERDDTDANGLLGTGMSESSGIWTFPSTGYWMVHFNARQYLQGEDRGVNLMIYVTTDNSTYNLATKGSAFVSQTSGDNTMVGQIHVAKLMDVTSTSLVKVKFTVDTTNALTTTQSDTAINCTYVMFTKLADT